MKKVIFILSFFLISTICIAKTNNEIRPKVKIFNDSEEQYSIIYYRTVLENQRIGFGIEYRDLKEKKDRRAISVEYSIKF